MRLNRKVPMSETRATSGIAVTYYEFSPGKIQVIVRPLGSEMKERNRITIIESFGEVKIFIMC